MSRSKRELKIAIKSRCDKFIAAAINLNEGFQSSKRARFLRFSMRQRTYLLIIPPGFGNMPHTFLEGGMNSHPDLSHG